MASISKLKPEQICFTVTRHNMGNTTMSTISVHKVRIKEVHEDHVVASWNGNTARKYYDRDVAKWKVSEPVTISSAMGHRRLATRAEIAEMKAKATI